MKNFIILSFVVLLLLNCNEENSQYSRKLIDGFWVEAKFLNDSILDGPAKYYNYQNRLVSVITYEEGIKHGQVMNFHENGQVYDSSWYFRGLKQGFHFVYDENGQVRYVDYYYRGHRIGPQTLYSNGQVELYRFTDFEKQEVYLSIYDSGKFNNSRGDMLNTNHYHLTVDDSVKNGIFAYFIHPPGIQVIYTLGLVSETQESIKNPIISFSYDRVFIDTILSLPPMGFHYFFSAEYIDSINNERKVIMDVFEFRSGSSTPNHD